ncbi:MAG: AbrB/MazE/SpoVT family DNA-binding domain-containing protein [Bryobacterales bacterium]|nr:AbrB/MazE/SpoVT family DNA-binding domain-containing protein [Bryobacterales bacterium]
MSITIDKAGRVVIPKAMRTAAGLGPGVSLSIEFRDGRIEIEPLRRDVKMEKRGGRMVLTAPAGVQALTNLDVKRLTDEIRENRGRTR